jgi:hypothetical protein
MTDERLDELQAACSGETDQDGKIELYRSDVLALVSELRELRRHASALSALEGAVGAIYRVVGNLCAYTERSPGAAASGGRIAVQDPGR